MDNSDNLPVDENEVLDPQEKPELDFNVEIEERSACERHITVKIPETEVSRYFSAELEELQDIAHVPGFRVGRAPKKLIERRFRKEVADRVKSNLVMDCLAQINDMDNLTPIGEPDFDFEKLVVPETGDFIFSFDLEVRPEFDLPDWKGLKLSKPTREFTQGDVDAVIERILDSHGTLVPTEEPAKEGDYILAKLTIKAGDTVVSSSDNETICLRPTLSFHDGEIKNFAEGMSGVKSGESRSLNVTLSADAAALSAYGDTLTAVFDIQEVKKVDRPEIDNKSLKEMGFDNIGDFRDAIQNRLELNLEYEQHQEARREITRLLSATTDWTLPPTLLERQSQREMHRAIMEMQRSGYSNEEISAQLNYIRQNSKAIVAQNLKEHFILEKIAEMENIDADEADYENEIMQIAYQTDQTPRRVRSQLEKQGEMDILRNQIVERKVINMILEHAEFTEVPYEISDRNVESIDRAASLEEQPSDIPEVTAEDAKETAREDIEKKLINPNAK